MLGPREVLMCFVIFIRHDLFLSQGVMKIRTVVESIGRYGQVRNEIFYARYNWINPLTTV